MELPTDLNTNIVKYLTSLPNIANEKTRRALVYGASLDTPLEELIDFNVSGSTQFFQLLIHDLIRFGKLQDGRDPLESLLKASQQYVGVDRKPYCELLIQEWQYHCQKGKTFIPDYTHDILVSYAFRDNKPVSGSDDGWVTKFVETLKNQMNQKLGGSDRYALGVVCLDQQVDGRSEITPEAVNRLRSAATLVIILSQNYVNSYSDQQLRNDIASLIKERTHLYSNVFLIEPDQLEDKDHLPEFCGLQSYPFLDEYGYTTRLHDLSCDLIDKLQNMHLSRKSAAMINATIASTSPKPQLVSSEVSSQPSTAFIDVDQSDWTLGDEIVQVLKKDGVGSIKPLQSEKVSENRAFFEEAVTMCECLIIIYGKVRPQWVIRQVGEILKISGPGKYKIIYDGPPEQKPDLPIIFPDIQIVECRKGTCDVCEREPCILIHTLQRGRIL